MKAIIVAAGMGRRLQPYTDDRPKCLVEVNGRSILARQLDAYRAAGVTEFAVVRGYRKAQVEIPGARHYDNDQYRENNILVSLLHAEPEMAGGFLFSYSDIVFTPQAVRAAVETPGDFALVIDRRWRDAYVGRKDHPVEEGEVARVDPTGRVLRVGKRTVPPDEAQGEFIGLARLSPAGAARFVARYHERRQALAGQPYGTAPRFEVAYVTDLFNDLIDGGERLSAAYIDGNWREIDTVEDLERAKEVVTW